MVLESDIPLCENPNSGGDAVPPQVESTDDNNIEEETLDDPLSDRISGVCLIDQVHDDDDDDDDDDVINVAEEEEEDMEFHNDDYDDDDDGPMSVLPPYVVQRVNKLKELHAQKENIMEEYLNDRAALEQKYHTLCAPLYLHRNNVINGIMDEEISAGLLETKDMVDQNVTDLSNKVAVGIPQFWVCAMGHMEVIAETITEEDVDCLEHLLDIKCLNADDGNGFTLEFQFGPNEYFQNTVLTKKYEVPNLLLADEPILKNVEGCKIQWLPKKCLTHREVIKKQRGKGKHAGQIRNVNKQERRDSFFHFFEPPKMPSMEAMDEEEAERLEELFDGDYDIAQAFRSHIIPNAVLWFTGQALEDEMQEMLAMTDLSADGGAPSSSPFPAPTPGDENPECKQN